MAKRSTSGNDDSVKPRRRAKTTAIPGPAEISIPVPAAEADDLSKPAIAGTIPVEIPGNTPTGEAIARRAYELYAADGYRHGHDMEHWLAAEDELKQRQRS
jgi:hypothetical protein